MRDAYLFFSTGARKGERGPARPLKRRRRNSRALPPGAPGRPPQDGLCLSDCTCACLGAVVHLHVDADRDSPTYNDKDNDCANRCRVLRASRWLGVASSGVTPLGDSRSHNPRVKGSRRPPTGWPTCPSRSYWAISQGRIGCNLRDVRPRARTSARLLAKARQLCCRGARPGEPDDVHNSIADEDACT